MKIVLTYDEIKLALVAAAEDKISDLFAFDVDDCYFDAVHIDGLEGEDHAIESIEFVCQN